MMMLGIPRARGLVKAANPKHGFGNKLEAHLKPLEVAFVGRYVVLTEYAELMLSNAEDHVGVDPRIGVAQVGLPGPVKRLCGDKHLEIARRMIVLGECPIRPRETQGNAEQYVPEIEMGHSKGSSERRRTPILDGVIGNDDNVFAGPARMYRRRRGRRTPAVAGDGGLRFKGNGHKLAEPGRGFATSG
jgi:hypothetical protein